jgi:hypothetical protein
MIDCGFVHSIAELALFKKIERPDGTSAGAFFFGRPANAIVPGRDRP